MTEQSLPKRGMGPWLRFYVSSVNNPKIQTLPDALFKAYINLLCVAKESDGALPDTAAVAFKMRVPAKQIAKQIDALIAARLIDKTPTGLVPHNWDERQFDSDGSTRRVRRFRERQRNVSNAVSETLDPRFVERISSVSEASTQEENLVREVGAVASLKTIVGGRI